MFAGEGKEDSQDIGELKIRILFSGKDDLLPYTYIINQIKAMNDKEKDEGIFVISEKNAFNALLNTGVKQIIRGHLWMRFI